MSLTPPRNTRAIKWALVALGLLQTPAWAVLKGWPFPGYSHVDFENPIGLVDPSQIPVVNTCLEPMKIEIDQSRVVGGVMPTGIGQPQGCNLPPYRGQWYEVMAVVPYTLTCGNGVKYAGEKKLVATGTLKEGCDHRDRPQTWPSAARVDENGMVRGMWWGDEDYDPVEIGFGIGNPGLRFDEAEIKKSFLGQTCVLPAYAGGQDKLARPVIFVHGLQVPYDETWGVRAISCNLDLSTVAPDTDAPKTKVVWKQNMSNGTFDLTLQAMVGFTGTCKTSKNQVPWESTWKDMFHYTVAPGFGGGEAWNNFEQDNIPTVTEIRVNGNALTGSVAVWVAKYDFLKGSFLPEGLSFGSIAATHNIDGLEYVKVALKFSIPLDKIDWEHASRARDLQGKRGFVDQDTADGGAYRSGTGADVLSRMQHLQKGEKINENGIYFFNGYRWNPDSARVLQPLPWWNDAGPEFKGQRGESWELYQFVRDVLTTHYGTTWRKDASKQVDLVCHSQGGISVREMLANAAGTDEDGKPLPQGDANPLNHIRKVVTVNTPHFGAVSTTDLEQLPSDYMNSLGTLIQDSGKTDITLADVDITPTMLGRMVGGYAGGRAGPDAATDAVSDWFFENDHGNAPLNGSSFMAGVALAPTWVPLASFVGWVAGTVGGATADWNVRMHGNWVKANNIKFTADWGVLGSMKVGEKDLDLDLGYGRVFSGRRKGAHLALNSTPVVNLALNYPKLPNGQDLNLQTLHSNVDGLGNLVRDILSQNLDGICDQSPDLQIASCYGFANTFRYGEFADAVVDHVDLRIPELQFLNDFQTGFMSKTDMTVDENSQKAVRDGGVWIPSKHLGKFQEPRGYDVRKFFTRGRYPDTLAPHGDLGISFSEKFLGHRFEANPSVIGAPMLGHDIYCALSTDCSDLLQLGGMAQLPEGLRSFVQVSLANASNVTRTVDAVPVAGDFSLAAMSQSGEVTGYRILNKDGKLLQEIFSGSGEGLKIRSTTGRMKQDVVPPGYTVNPVIVRNGDDLSVKVTTWTGQEIERSFTMSAAPTDTLLLQVLSTDTGDARPVLIGSFSIDTALRNPGIGTRVELWFREARGAQTTQSKPRMMLRNAGSTTIHGLEMIYTFRADPNHPPQLTAPEGAPWSLQARGGDLWNLVYRDSLAVIPPNSIWPSAQQAQVTLQMSNGAQWSVFKDPSNDRNFGQPSLNHKIVARDGQGRILWGQDAGNGDVERPEIRKVSAWTREAAVGEKNVSKPELEIRNEGNIPLQGLTARWYVRLPATSRAVLERWHLPEGTAHLDSLGNGVWAIVWDLPRWIQPGEKIVGGNIGVHLADWSVWNHSASPSAYGRDGEWHTNPWVVVTDANGKVLWGNVPVLTAGIPVADTSKEDTTAPDTTKAPSLLVEVKNEALWETNTVKPRVRVTNLGRDTVRAFALRFDFAEANATDIVTELWYPGNECSLSHAESGNVQHATLTCRNLAIVPGQMWPDASGAVFGVHHADWSVWDRSNDPSFSALRADFAPTQAVEVLP